MLRLRSEALCGVLLVLATLGAAPSIASASKPAVVSFSVAPHSLPSGGGVITVTGRVLNAATCTVYDDVSPITVGRASGRFRVRRRRLG